MLELIVEVPGAPQDVRQMLNRVSQLCCAQEGIEDMMSFGRLVDDLQIRELNRAFRSIDKPTDVLSFPSISYAPGKTARDSLKRLRRERDPESGLCVLGDFVISLPRARAQAEEYGHSLRRELCYLTAHAQFHLMGYDHERESDKAAMREKEERVMNQMQLTREGFA